MAMIPAAGMYIFISILNSLSLSLSLSLKRKLLIHFFSVTNDTQSSIYFFIEIIN